MTLQTSSETSHVSSLCLAFDQRQAESGGFFAHRGDLTGTAALVIFLGAQVAKRGAMGEQVIDDPCDLVSRGDNGGFGGSATQVMLAKKYAFITI
jgi:hypothetical protein